MKTVNPPLSAYSFVAAIAAGMWCYASLRSDAFFLVATAAAIIAFASFYLSRRIRQHYGQVICGTALALILFAAGVELYIRF